MSKGTVIGLTWPVSLIAAVLLGWYGHGDSGRPTAPSGAFEVAPGLKTSTQPMSEGGTAVWLCAGDGQALAQIRRNESSKHLGNMTLYGSDDKPVLDVIRYPSGAIKNLIIRQAGRHKYDWMFSEAGLLKYHTVYVQRNADDVGTRQHYGPNGACTSTSEAIVHHGS